MKPGRLRPAAESELHSMAGWYFERDDHLNVVRLLGERQDSASILAAGLE